MKWIVAPLACVLLTALPARPSDAAWSRRPFATGHFVLELGGRTVGFLRSVEGGGVKADVVLEPPGSDTTTWKKHVGPLRYEPITVEAGITMGPELYDWLSAFFDGKGERRSGAIIAADFNYKERARRQFTDALITEVSFPAMDGASKESAYLKITLVPESIRDQLGTGAPVPPAPASTQKKWLTSNFKFSVGDLPCSRIGKIEAFKLVQETTTTPVDATGLNGPGKPPTLEPTKVEYPNLRFYIPSVDAQAWIDWAEAFLIQGKNGDGSELEGALTFLDPNRGSLARIDLHHVGMAGYSLFPPTASGDPSPYLTVEIYTEKMDFVRTP